MSSVGDIVFSCGSVLEVGISFSQASIAGGLTPPALADHLMRSTALITW